MPLSRIEELADIMLSEEELALSGHLSILLGNDKYNSGAAFAAILPRYWTGKGKSRSALPPRSIFKRLYYVHATAGMREFSEKTRDFLVDVAGFLEGCLFHLFVDADHYANANLPFGRLVVELRKKGAISEELAMPLQTYNKVVNVSSKHFDAFPPKPRLDERTFSVYDASLAFIMARRLSIQIFPLLRAKRAIPDVEWPPYDPRWLRWFPLIDERPKSSRV